MISPPDDVVAEFGADLARLRPLPGGQRRTWTDGSIVLKPADNPVEHAWVCEVYADWPLDVGVRVPVPVPARSGGWVYAGWAAHHYSPGRSATMLRESDVIRRASESFHAQTRDLSRPAFLEHRDDAWSVGDRVAWEDGVPEGAPSTLDQIARLRDAFAPVRAPSQVIHGDIGGNVLIADDGPVVIDWPPYFRPVGFALAVAVADAVCWESVQLDFVDAWSDVPQWYQLLARALVYRIATTGVGQQAGLARLNPDAQAAVTEPAVGIVLDRLARS